MPIYEYVCRRCDKRFEELVRSADETVVCPGCGTKKIQRSLSAFAVQSGGAAGSSGREEWGACPPEGCPPCRGG